MFPFKSTVGVGRGKAREGKGACSAGRTTSDERRRRASRAAGRETYLVSLSFGREEQLRVTSGNPGSDTRCPSDRPHWSMVTVGGGHSVGQRPRIVLPPSPPSPTPRSPSRSKPPLHAPPLGVRFNIVHLITAGAHWHSRPPVDLQVRYRVVSATANTGMLARH